MKSRAVINIAMWLAVIFFDRRENKTWNCRKLSGFVHERYTVLKNTGSWLSNCESSKKKFQFLAKWHHFQKIYLFFDSEKQAHLCACTKFRIGRSTDILRKLWRLRNWNPRLPITSSHFAIPGRQNSEPLDEINLYYLLFIW